MTTVMREQTELIIGFYVLRHHRKIIESSMSQVFSFKNKIPEMTVIDIIYSHRSDMPSSKKAYTYIPRRDTIRQTLLLEVIF